MRDTRGAVVIARKIIDSDIFVNKPDKWLKIWLFIVLVANYKDKGKFNRGEVFTTYQEICSYTKATRNEVDHCIRWLKSATQITTRKATRGMYINIVNYNVYQKLDSYKSDTESDTKSDLKAIGRRYKSDTKREESKERKKDISKSSFSKEKGLPKSKKKNYDDPLPLSLPEFVEKMRQSPQRHMRIIAEYADEIKCQFTKKGQWLRFIDRNVRQARNLVGYTDDQISDAFEELQKNLKTKENPKGYITKWSLETIEKFI